MGKANQIQKTGKERERTVHFNKTTAMKDIAVMTVCMILTFYAFGIDCF